MKLNPPASSSDLDIARQIARRLHQHRRRDDQVAAAGPADEAPARTRLTPPPLPHRPAPVGALERPSFRPQDAASPVPPPRPRPEAPPEPPPRRVPPPPEPQVARREPAFEPEPPEPSFDLPETPQLARPTWAEPDAVAPEPEPLAALGEPQGATDPGLPDVDMDEPPLSPEAMVGETGSEGSPLDALTEPEAEASPFDDALPEAPEVAEEPAAPSWDDIVETCLGLAHSRGAMLIDPAGQVFAARGDWPAPGPEAIASKLVAMMAKTLKDAPTRSISAPVMGMHLTAWRVPLPEGLVTAAFIGAAPVRADARPAIDGEITSGVRSR
jgi:hypothetical protein